MSKKSKTVHLELTPGRIACGLRNPAGVPTKHTTTLYTTRATCKRCRQIARVSETWAQQHGRQLRKLTAPLVKKSKRKSPIHIEKKGPAPGMLKVSDLVNVNTEPLRPPEGAPGFIRRHSPNDPVRQHAGDYKPEDIERAVLARAVARTTAFEIIRHPDDLAIERFVISMRIRMHNKRKTFGDAWHSAPAIELIEGLKRSMCAAQWVDVANFAMMLFTHKRGFDVLKRCPHGYLLEELARGDVTCEKCGDSIKL